MRVIGIFLLIAASIFKGKSLLWKTVKPTSISHTVLNQQHDSSPITEKYQFQNQLISKLKALNKVLFPMSSAILANSLLPSPARAENLEDINQKLNNYGLPPMLFVPPGFNPLVSEYGRGNIREAMSNPILVQFVYPQVWVVQKTSVNNNGEAGTISANDYMKGDSAFLYVYPIKDKPTLSSSNTELIKNYVISALSQKGDPTEELKILRIADGPKGVDGTQYILVDFAYQLNTEAGFLIGRRGVLSLTAVGEGFLQGFVSVTTQKRWPQLEASLRTVADSFRVYRLKSGIFSSTTL